MVRGQKIIVKLTFSLSLFLFISCDNINYSFREDTSFESSSSTPNQKDSVVNNDSDENSRFSNEADLLEEIYFR
tara:strand:- start:9 stop:230 length:222 start_codon:yes stop_codon:yes gene_type:complete